MIKVTKEPDLGPPLERCCFCRKPTKYWFKSKRTRDVACCQGCARRADPVDVPTKTIWCRRERIADREFNSPPDEEKWPANRR